jgi:phosphopantothenoylcysteine synthetase/decarboxylase
MAEPDASQRTLAVVVCGAGVATDVTRLVDLAHADGWRVALIATPAALPFLDVPALEAQTGNPVRSHHEAPDEPRAHSAARAGAVIVAPATFNTVNKVAAGIADNYALGVLAEAIALGKPIVMVPAVGATLARRAPFRQAVDGLRAEGVHVLLEADVHAAFPWAAALALAGAGPDRGPHSAGSPGDAARMLP